MTGKNTVRDFVNSALRDLLRLATQKNITGPLFSSMESGGFFSGIGKMLGFLASPPAAVHGRRQRRHGQPDGGLPRHAGEQVSVRTPTQQAGAGVSIEFNIVNSSSQPVQAESKGSWFDGRKFIQEVVLSDIESYRPIRTAVSSVR